MSMPLDSQERPSAGGLRLRTLLVGVPIMIALCFVTVYGDMVVKQVQIGILQLPPAALGTLFVLILATRSVRWLLKREVLGSRDLLPLYVMMTIVVLMCSRGTIEKLIPPQIWTNYYATTENKYMELLGEYTPDWLVAYDPHGELKQDVAVDYHEGNAQVPWRLWVGPILSWSGLLCFIYLSFFSLAVLLRRQWADHEKLVFPLVTLPVAIIDDDSATRFFGNRLTWMGVAIPVLIYTVNTLHANIPAVPEIKLDWTLNQFLHTRPWNGIYNTKLVMAFAAIGFFYFLASDLLFSLWFFFVLTRVTDVIGTQLGNELTVMPNYPTRLYIGYQVAGAYLVLTITLFRSGWGLYGRQLRDTWRRVGDASWDGPDHEIVPYRVAVWGLAIGTAGAVVWCVYAGLDAWLAVFEVVVYVFVVALVLSRGVAEAGLLQTEASFRPVDLVKLWRPQFSLGPRNLTVLAMLDTVLTRDLRGVLLSNFLDDQKMARELHLRPRALALPIVVAMVVALVFGCYFFLRTSYDLGQINLYGYPGGNARLQLNEAATVMQQQIRTEPETRLSFLVGLAVCSALVVLRTTVVWWPLHPLGYAFCGSWTMLVFWFTAFVTWVIKGFILRSGGMKLYRQLMPFFLGLVLGSFLMALALTMIAFVGELNQVVVNAPSLGFL